VAQGWLTSLEHGQTVFWISKYALCVLPFIYHRLLG